jgi:hypothetical protein
MIVCVVPLYSHVAMTAGLRNTLQSSPSELYTTVHGAAEVMPPYIFQNINDDINRMLTQHLNNYLNSRNQFSIQNTLALTEYGSTPQQRVVSTSQDQVRLIGTSIEQASSHVKLVQGHLPRPLSEVIEVAIASATATTLHLGIGSVITGELDFDYVTNGQTGSTIPVQIPLHVVGIFNLPSQSDVYWHEENFQPRQVFVPLKGEPPLLYPVLVSNETLLSVASFLILEAAEASHLPLDFDAYLSVPFDLFWYYPLDISRIDSNNVDDLITGFDGTLADFSAYSVSPRYISSGKLDIHTPLSLLTEFRSRTLVGRIPMMILTYLIIGLVLFFVCLMTHLLVDHQSDAIAVLRGRGASRRQIFASMVTQGIGTGLLALFVGPMLAIVAAQFLAHSLLSPVDQEALGVITNNPLQTALELRWMVLATVGVGVLAMILSLFEKIRQNILVVRQEAARSTHRPMWQRLRLDVIALVIALISFSFSLYTISAGVLDERVRVLILPPMILMSILFLLLGCMLLFLRILPPGLNLMVRLVSRSRGATPMLALAHIARAPQKSVRISLLLALAVALAVFTLAFSASQVQRIDDVSAYQVGSDFSGLIPPGSSLSTMPLNRQTALYEQIPGVTSVTVGYSTSVMASDTQRIPVELRAVEASTYAKTSIWTSADSRQPLSSLISLLVAQRASAARDKEVPVIIDASASVSLHLSIGSHFTIEDLTNKVNCVVIAQVENIPTVNDSIETSVTDNGGSFGGILVDYTTYATVSEIVNHIGITTTNVWIRTRDDASALASVRNALNKGSLQLIGLNDRRALMDNLRNDPIYLALIGILFSGTTAALALALLGNLVISWQYARMLLANFAVMRALGCTTRQILSVLVGGQGLIYMTAIVLGTAIGILFSALALPILVFTSIPTGESNAEVSTIQFYVMQNAPPVQTVIPTLPISIILAVVVVICALALSVMGDIVLRPSISQVLRINVD